MARALMTPDELRRMDSNTCIILLQAMKPIKANKYFYFRMHPLWPDASKVQANHRDIGAPQRGFYKITNPYDLQKLDDIFGPAPTKAPAPSQSTSNPFASSTSSAKNAFNEFDIYTTNLVKAKNEISSDFQIDKNVAPASATIENKDSNKINENALIKGNGASEVCDLQAELEKKFDELFGDPIKKSGNFYS
jgi:hypothetical protein